MPETLKRSLRLCTMLLTSLLFCAVLFHSSASAVEYPDAKGHWAEAAVDKWSDFGIIKGYANGNFGPNDSVTRAQLSEMLYRIWDIAPVGGYTFPDLSPSAWYCESLTTMNAYGVALNTDALICPDEPLSREEAFYMIARAFAVGNDYNSNPKQSGNYISDFEAICRFYAGRIDRMLSNGFLKGASDGAFHPQRTVTRAEVITVIDNMVDRVISQPGEYTIPAGQNILVSCSGVKLNYTLDQQPLRPKTSAFLMPGASESGVTFSSVDPLKLRVYSVSQTHEAWSTEGGCKASLGSFYRLSAAVLDDQFRFAAGTGQEMRPFLIETAEQFRLIPEISHNYYYKLLNDIELPGNHTPMGSPDPSTPVRGNLDGNGHTLTYHMTANAVDENNYGLFRIWDGDCSNLVVAGTINLSFPSLPEDRHNIFIGGLAGYYPRKSHTVNCTSRLQTTIRYQGNENIHIIYGGLAGVSDYVTFEDCMAEGSAAVIMPDAIGYATVGGLVGSSFEDRDKLTGCGSAATLSVQNGYHSIAGGLIGSCTPLSSPKFNDKATVILAENCWSTAAISVSGASFQNDCGGIAGQIQRGVISGCWAKPTVSASDTGGSFVNVGGISGAVYMDGIIANCWANVSDCTVPAGVSAMDGHYGGITGRMAGEIDSCFVMGATEFASENKISYASWTEGPVTGCIDMTEITQAQKDAFYQTCGWDFDAVWDKSGSYPILKSCDKAAQEAAQA